MGAQKLKAKIEAYIDSVREFEAKYMGPDWARGGKWDSLKDTGVWIGEELPERRKGYAAVLHFDGAGYDYFNHADALPGHREQVEKIASELGYEMQDLNTWSIGFILDQ